MVTPSRDQKSASSSSELNRRSRRRHAAGQSRVDGLVPETEARHLFERWGATQLVATFDRQALPGDPRGLGSSQKADAGRNIVRGTGPAQRLFADELRHDL